PAQRPASRTPWRRSVVRTRRLAGEPAPGRDRLLRGDLSDRVGWQRIRELGRLQRRLGRSPVEPYASTAAGGYGHLPRIRVPNRNDPVHHNQVNRCEGRAVVYLVGGELHGV